MRQRFIERGLYFALGLVALATLIDAAAFIFTPEKMGNDFRVFWTAANSAAPYAPTQWPFAYPPTTLIWLQPLALFSFGAALALWIGASMAAYALGVRQEIGERWPIAFLLFPTAFSLLTGQISMFVAAMAFAAFRTKYAGLILGLAFTIKPQLVFLAPVAFLFVKDWRNLAYFMVAVYVVVCLSVFAFGWSIWFDWLQSFEHFQAQAAALNVLGGAASPAGMATWHELNPLPFLLASGALALFTLYRGFAATEHKGALLGLCCILASPYALIYDLVIVLPLVVADLLKPNLRTIPAFLCVTVKLQVAGVIGVALSYAPIKARREESLVPETA